MTKQELKENLRKLKNKYHMADNADDKYQIKLENILKAYKSAKTEDEIAKLMKDTKKLQKKFEKKREVK